MTESALDRVCDKYGCAKVGLDPKLHEFDDCFAGSIRFGDIDGAVERHGNILWMEWKVSANLPTFDKDHEAQIIQALAFTRNSPLQTFVFVIGCPQTMRVDWFRYIRRGNWKGDWKAGDGDTFKQFLRYWFSAADDKAKMKLVS